jgi:hypothetical protein
MLVSCKTERIFIIIPWNVTCSRHEMAEISLLLLLSGMCCGDAANNTNCLWYDPFLVRTHDPQGEHDNHYITDAVTQTWYVIIWQIYAVCR